METNKLFKKDVLNDYKFKKINILYGQSGGPTPVINTSFYGIYKTLLSSLNNTIKVDNLIVMNYGIEGLLNEELEFIKASFFASSDYNYDNLKNTSGSYFGSNRYKLKDFNEDESDYKKILETFKKYNIRIFFYNGGNDSMDTINKISQYLEKQKYICTCIALPKTIDNDLMNIDFSLGFPSAAKFIINSLINIYNDDMSYKVGRVNIVEVMGRNAGWLAASSYYLQYFNIIDVDLIYIPEFSFEKTKFLEEVKCIYNSKKHCLVVVSEGIKDKDNNFLYEANSKVDEFNHNSLGGVASFLASLVTKELGFKVRAIELSLLQRANSFSPSKIDLDMAMNTSKRALKDALKYIYKDPCFLNNKMISFEYDEYKNKYIYKYIPLDQVANKERKMNIKYLDYKNETIKEEYAYYIKRVIAGNVNTFSKYGTINFLKRFKNNESRKRSKKYD